MEIDLIKFQTTIFDRLGLKHSEPIVESESKEYSGCVFKTDLLTIRFRVSKITPTKTGQFVTLWKRNQDGITEPFNVLDKFDYVIICSQQGNQIGQFVFSKQVLEEHGIISSKIKEGKRAIRVYPPWSKTENNQAKKTQQWQLNYFIDLSNFNKLDFKNLYKDF